MRFILGERGPLGCGTPYVRDPGRVASNVGKGRRAPNILNESKVRHLTEPDERNGIDTTLPISATPYHIAFSNVTAAHFKPVQP